MLLLCVALYLAAHVAGSLDNFFTKNLCNFSEGGREARVFPAAWAENHLLKAMNFLCANESTLFNSKKIQIVKTSSHFFLPHSMQLSKK